MFCSRSMLILSAFLFNVNSNPFDSATIHKYTNHLEVDGYNFTLETHEIDRSENGFLKTNGEKKFLVIKGDYSISHPDGSDENLMFVADEKGYRAKFEIGDLSDSRIPSDSIASLIGGGLG